MQDKWTLGLCAECDQELDPSVRPSLYCRTRCRGVAKDVRYFRRAYRDGRSQDPEVRQALKKRFAIHLAGGYDARGRALPQGVREEVLAANGGLCMACNAERATEVDHVDGSSSDRANLQGFVALAALADLELDGLALFELPVTRAVDVGEVHEHVGTAFARDETETLLCIEELDGADGHCCTSTSEPSLRRPRRCTIPSARMPTRHAVDNSCGRETPMTTGFDHLYVETHDWVAALAFWARLGFQLEYDTGHQAGARRFGPLEAWRDLGSALSQFGFRL